MNVLDNIVETCSKEILEEKTNIKQTLITMLSAWTNNPQNTRILAPSGEGKTYLVTKVASLFPEENVVILAKATPQSFKYAFSSKKVVEYSPGIWQDYEIAIQPLEEDFKKIKDDEKRQEIKNQIRQLKDSACDLVDFTNKIIILVDSQSIQLFESIKTTLSHDQYEIKSFSVNKSKSGTIQGQKFIIRGFPAVIYCSAKDEQSLDITDEINTRFNTISLNSNPKKYRKMLELEAIRSSLPDSIYQEEVISYDEIEHLRNQVREIIEQVRNYGEVLNPFGLGLERLFKADGGFRTRQFKILNSNITIHTLVNAKYRPKIIHDEIKVPVVTWTDIEESCNLIKEPREIQPYKIKFFNDCIRASILEYGKEKQFVDGSTRCLTASEIADILTKKGRATDRQKLQETFLKPLVSHGFLEEFTDPDNKSRHIYALGKTYLEEQASIESTLIDTSTLDLSCVDSFINEYLKQRFESGNLRIFDENNCEITPDKLIELLHTIDTQHPQNRNEIDIIEASTSIENRDVIS
ncbi:MAG: hypothetical protein FJ356_04525 [Thaumarchaeota archaeon]|nr:hypothetical protein [Nitrososphaerota archaeon]